MAFGRGRQRMDPRRRRDLGGEVRRQGPGCCKPPDDEAVVVVHLRGDAGVEWLAECNVDRRARMLLDSLGKPWKGTPLAPATTGYPPRFSTN